MFCRELYLDEYTSKHFRSIRKKLKNRTVQPGIYVIVLSRNTGNVEYMHNAFLCQKYYQDNPPFVIGLAHSRDSVLDMIQGMLTETYQTRGDYNLRAYLKEKTERLSHKKAGRYHINLFRREEKKC